MRLFLCTLLLCIAAALHSQPGARFDPDNQPVARLYDGRPRLLVSEYLLCQALKLRHPETPAVNSVGAERIQQRDYLVFDCSTGTPPAIFWKIFIPLRPDGQGNFLLEEQTLVCKGESCSKCSRETCLCEADEPGQTGACTQTVRQGPALAKVASDGN